MESKTEKDKIVNGTVEELTIAHGPFWQQRKSAVAQEVGWGLNPIKPATVADLMTCYAGGLFSALDIIQTRLATLGVFFTYDGRQIARGLDEYASRKVKPLQCGNGVCGHCGLVVGSGHYCAREPGHESHCAFSD